MKTALLNLRTLHAVSLVASTDETRCYLNGVCVEARPDHVLYVATDGHRMLAVRENVDGGNDLEGTWIIPLDICRAFKPSKRKHAALESAVLSVEPNGDLRLAGVQTTTQIFKPVDGTFPDWRRIVPTTLSGAIEEHKTADPESQLDGIWFNPAYQLDFVKVGKILEAGAPHFAVNGTSAAGVYFADENVFGLLMPLLADTQAEAAEQFSARRAFVLGEKREETPAKAAE